MLDKWIYPLETKRTKCQKPPLALCKFLSFPLHTGFLWGGEKTPSLDLEIVFSGVEHSTKLFLFNLYLCLLIFSAKKVTSILNWSIFNTYLRSLAKALSIGWKTFYLFVNFCSLLGAYEQCPRQYIAALGWNCLLIMLFTESWNNAYGSYQTISSISAPLQQDLLKRDSTSMSWYTSVATLGRIFRRANMKWEEIHWSSVQ